ncbi:MAG: metal-dependent hydrolase [Myxococcota bacterium]
MKRARLHPATELRTLAARLANPMDPIAHTLVGGTLAESGLRRVTPLATATLLIGANAPDIDIVSAVGGTDASLYWRRGVTHGVVAWVVLPLVLTGLMLLWDRAVRRRRRPDAEPARAGPLLGLAFLSVLTHPALDWLNTYGVRVLSPFDGQWFYGDAIFIVDPWLWLLMAAALVLARSTGRLSAAAWIVLGCAATALVFLAGMVPVGAKAGWGIGVATIVGLRLWGRDEGLARRVARTCTVLAVLYIGVMIGASQTARADARAWLEQRGLVVDEIAAGPVPSDPFTWDVIARVGDRYHFLERSWIGRPALRTGHPPIPVGPRNEVVRAALRAPSVRGMREWMRFPSFEVQPEDDGYTVTIRDVRYSRRSEAKIGTAVVRLDRSLRPR